jgi:hypothetical protein
VVKYRTVIAKHNRDLSVIDDLWAHLNGWEYLGRETVTGNMRVLFPVNHRWYAVRIGKRQGPLGEFRVRGIRQKIPG